MEKKLRLVYDLVIWQRTIFPIQVLNNTIPSYVLFDVIVHVITQKLRKKLNTYFLIQSMQTEKAKFSLILTGREVAKTK